MIGTAFATVPAAVRRIAVRSLGVLFACACGLLGCRIGGASSDPLAFDPVPPSDASTPRNDDAQSGTDRDPPTDQKPAPEAGPINPPVRDAGTDRPPGADADADADAASEPNLDAGATGSTDAESIGPNTADAASCMQQPAVCDPIRNTGCLQELGMQCDVDLLAPMLSGVCVFSTPQPDGGSCINIPPTESCPPGQTCVGASKCQEVCLCDSDCEPGNCCTTPLGDQGFKTCSKC